MFLAASSCSGLSECLNEIKCKVNNQFLFLLQSLPALLRFSWHEFTMHHHLSSALDCLGEADRYFARHEEVLVAEMSGEDRRGKTAAVSICEAGIFEWLKIYRKVTKTIQRISIFHTSNFPCYRHLTLI